MLMPAMISLLVGMVLGQRFKVLILAPAILLTVFLALAAAVTRPDGAWVTGEIAAIAVMGLQIGYLLGLGVRHLTLLARASRRRAVSLTRSMPPRRPAH